MHKVEVKWCHSKLNGAILYISMIDKLLHINYSLFVFLLDNVEHGWYITCGVYVKKRWVKRSPGNRRNGNNLIVNSAQIKLENQVLRAGCDFCQKCRLAKALPQCFFK